MSWVSSKVESFQLRTGPFVLDGTLLTCDAVPGVSLWTVGLRTGLFILLLGVLNGNDSQWK